MRDFWRSFMCTSIRVIPWEYPDNCSAPVFTSDLKWRVCDWQALEMFCISWRTPLYWDFVSCSRQRPACVVAGLNSTVLDHENDTIHAAPRLALDCLRHGRLACELRCSWRWSWPQPQLLERITVSHIHVEQNWHIRCVHCHAADTTALATIQSHAGYNLPTDRKHVYSACVIYPCNTHAVYCALAEDSWVMDYANCTLNAMSITKPKYIFSNVPHPSKNTRLAYTVNV